MWTQCVAYSVFELTSVNLASNHTAPQIINTAGTPTVLGPGCYP